VWKVDKVMTKTILLVFLRHSVDYEFLFEYLQL